MGILDYLLKWLINLPQQFIDLWSWLSADLPYIHMSPLMLLSAGGIITVVGLLAFRLVMGG